MSYFDKSQQGFQNVCFHLHSLIIMHPISITFQTTLNGISVRILLQQEGQTLLLVIRVRESVGRKASPKHTARESKIFQPKK